MRNQRTRRAGVTLMELVIAMGLLAIVAAPILGMYMASTRMSALSYKITVASLFAQRCMEELVGQEVGVISGFAGGQEYKTELMFTATVESFEEETEGGGDVSPHLWRVRVTVTETGTGNVLSTHTDILNVGERGGLPALEPPGGGP